MNHRSTIVISEENSIIENGEIKKFTYDNSFAINAVTLDHMLNVVIPDGIFGVGERAFGGRSDVFGVHFGKDVKNIHCSAFSGCDDLVALTVDPANTELHSAGNCVIATKDKRMIIGCRASEIPDDGSVTQIRSAFYECKSLIRITVPEGITHLGENAFYGCGLLKEVHLPKSLKSIGKNAFYGCAATNAWGTLDPPVEIYYAGTTDEWFAIEGGATAFEYTSELHCSDETM